MAEILFGLKFRLIDKMNASNQDSPESRREELLFELALTKPLSERDAWLARECTDDPAMRQRIAALLAAHEQTGTVGGMTEPPQLGPTIKLEFAQGTDETVGQSIGRYKLLEKVGEGGCGVVYVAEQTEPVRRRVALKVIKLSLACRQKQFYTT